MSSTDPLNPFLVTALFDLKVKIIEFVSDTKSLTLFGVSPQCLEENIKYICKPSYRPKSLQEIQFFLSGAHIKHVVEKGRGSTQKLSTLGLWAPQVIFYRNVLVPL